MKTVTVGNFGKVLASGKTLYVLKPSSTPCTAACLKVWPPLVLPSGATKATASPGVSSSKLGTKTTAGGVRQVTYGGKPLYFFVGDAGPRQVHGNVSDTWGTWTAAIVELRWRVELHFFHHGRRAHRRSDRRGSGLRHRHGDHP